ncbi:hypothetical protein SAMN04488072_1048 [Lentibacillus halodurans]|uniref:Uncharacterized protein n=1 Tax=Lentibacillus halodurans TaxID=237679 RepID=A0A1I0X0K1_9BACI|nr:hypothetical protein [Lentibacillus halodurans]SFA93663.1 hypothetical protein SAMN04488072_1048 [Lentibacillus halodurans]
MNQVNVSYQPEMKIKNTKESMMIQLNDEPKAQHRPNTKEELIQDHSMMHFQQLVMKEAQAALRANSIAVFKNDIAIETEIVSVQSPQSVRLEMVLKAIFDSLNKSVVDDDHLITHAQVWLYKGQKRYPKTKIHVRIEDLVTRNHIHFTCELPLVEKKPAVVYNIASTMQYDFQNAADAKIIEHALLSQKFTTPKQYEICHMLFHTSDKSKDVDNMLLMYIDVLRRQGLLNLSDTVGIGIYKKHVDKSDEKVDISLVSK